MSNLLFFDISYMDNINLKVDPKSDEDETSSEDDFSKTNDKPNNKKEIIIEFSDEENDEKEKNDINYDSDDTEVEQETEESLKEEKRYRKIDKEYGRISKISDKITELVISLSEKQYEAGNLYNRFKKIMPEEKLELRKNFVINFFKFKNSIETHNLKKFFNILSDWIEVQKEIIEIDEELFNLKKDR